MKVVLALTACVGVHGSAVSSTVDQVCSTFASSEPQQQVGVTFGSRFDSLFSDSIDCSAVPTNPRLGYSLTGVSVSECAAASTSKLVAIEYAAQQMHYPQCSEKTIDDHEGSATLLIKFQETDIKLDYPNFAAVKFGFDTDGKINSYQVAFDSYPFLFAPGSLTPKKVTGQTDSGRIPEASGKGRAAWKIHAHGGPVARAVQKVCDSITYSTPVHVGSAKWAEKVRETFEQFAPKLSCAENQNNPLVGYTEQDVVFGDCASHSTYSHHFKIDELVGDCLQIVNDEKGHTSAAWMTYASEGDADPFKFAGVTLYWLSPDAKIIGYLSIYDTWDVISKASGVDLAAAVVATGANQFLLMLMAVPLLGVVGLFAFRKMRPSQGSMEETLLDAEVQ